jgi:hypothetical protein
MRAKSKGIDIFLVVEDKDGFDKIMNGNYRSMYSSKAFIGKLTSLEVQYLKGIIWTSPDRTGYHIARLLYAFARDCIKKMCVEVVGNEE